MNILVVEDQETTRTIVASRLRNWGHSVVELDDGLEALSYIVNNKDSVDILITDWSMPSMDGITLAGKVRKLTESSNYIYIILFTIRNDNTDLVRGFSEGQVDDYIVKPFSAVQLRLHVDAGCRVIRSERKLRNYSADLEFQVRRHMDVARDTQAEIISRLYNALESRDQKTAQRVQRIGVMSVGIARRLGWDVDKLNMLKAAAPMHDIGKIGISDVLLNQDKETQEIDVQHQLHTIIGARILSGSRNPAIQMAERIALSHHENWDGSGYPNGLHGDQIPIEAQIVSIVDTYDSKICESIYGEGLPEKDVISYIRWQANKKFSSTLTKLFLRHLDEFKESCWTVCVR